MQRKGISDRCRKKQLILTLIFSGIYTNDLGWLWKPDSKEPFNNCLLLSSWWNNSVRVKIRLRNRFRCNCIGLVIVLTSHVHPCRMNKGSSLSGSSLSDATKKLLYLASLFLRAKRKNRWCLIHCVQVYSAPYQNSVASLWYSLFYCIISFPSDRFP